MNTGLLNDKTILRYLARLWSDKRKAAKRGDVDSEIDILHDLLSTLEDLADEIEIEDEDL